MRADVGGTVTTAWSFDAAAGDTLRWAAVTQDRLVLKQSASSGEGSLQALGLTGAAPTPLVSATNIGAVYALPGNELLYVTHPDLGVTYSLRRIHTDGSNDRLIANGQGGTPMTRYKRTVQTASDYDFGLESIAWCESTDPDCKNGTLKSFNTSTGTTTTLGTFSHAAGTSNWSIDYGSAFGEPSVFIVYARDQANGWKQDVYIASENRANSLSRVTSNLP
jgi:hypothetical protein